MTDAIEFDPVDAIGAGAFGQPGARTFVIQARKGQAMLSVLVEKEQVALLAAEAEQFLDRIAEEHPEEPGTFGELATGGAVEEDDPLFRARLIGIGFDPERSLVLLELREQAADDDETPPAVGGERRARRPAVRDACADPGDARQRRGRGRGRAGRSARCATSRWIPTGTSARG